MADNDAAQTVAEAETWFVYLLRCADGSLYTGITKDVGRRSRQHNAGTASRYTRSRRPTRMLYAESQVGQSQALKREAAIKALSRREKELLIQRRDSSDAHAVEALAAATCGLCPDRQS